MNNAYNKLTEALRALQPLQAVMPTSTMNFLAQLDPVAGAFKTMTESHTAFVAGHAAFGQTKVFQQLAVMKHLQTTLGCYGNSFGLHGKIHKMMQGGNTITHPMVTVAEKLQALYPASLRHIQRQLKVAGLNSASVLPNSIMRLQSAMQAVDFGTAGAITQVAQIKEFASRLGSVKLAALAADTLSPAIADYLKAHPLTEAEWEEAAHALHAEGESAINAPQSLAEIAAALDMPGHSRWRLALVIFGILVLLMLTVGGMTMADDEKDNSVQWIWCLMTVASTALAQPLLAYAQKIWQSPKGAIPAVAIIINSSGKNVPIRSMGNPNSPIIQSVPARTLVRLGSERTRSMASVVGAIDENGDAIQIVWIAKKHLKRISTKRAAKLKQTLQGTKSLSRQ